MTGPEDLLEQAWEIFRREVFVISGGSAAHRRRLGFTDAFERAMKRHRQAGGRENSDE